jgi:glycosyltransferase domain-containing protein
MNTNNKLTMILVLKDRATCTARWLSWAKFIGVTHRIIVADGSLGNENYKLFNNDNLYKRLDLEYVRYKPDNTLSDFCHKMLSAIKSVNTPYVLFMANDDLIFPDGLNMSIEFLEQNKDFGFARGKVMQFCLRKAIEPAIDNLYGRAVIFNAPYWDQPSLTSHSSVTRVKQQICNGSSLWHDVMRKDFAYKLYELQLELSVKDLNFNCIITDFLGAAESKSFRTTKWLYMLQQVGSVSLGIEMILTAPTQFEWLRKEHWRDDYEKISHAISMSMSVNDNISLDHASAIFNDEFSKMLARKILNDDRVKKPKVALSARDFQRFDNLRAIKDRLRIVFSSHRSCLWKAANFLSGPKETEKTAIKMFS